jgi:hypothetical protein
VPKPPAPVLHKICYSCEPFIPLADRTLAMTLLYEYQGGDFSVRWWRWEPGITGYFGRFRLQ